MQDIGRHAKLMSQKSKF